MKTKKITKAIFDPKNRSKFFVASGLVVAFLILTSVATGNLGNYLSTLISPQGPLGGPGVGLNSGALNQGSPGSAGSGISPGSGIANQPVASGSKVTLPASDQGSPGVKMTSPQGPTANPSIGTKPGVVNPQGSGTVGSSNLGKAVPLGPAVSGPAVGGTTPAATDSGSTSTVGSPTATTKTNGGMISNFINNILGKNPSGTSQPAASGTKSTPAASPGAVSNGTTVQQGSGTSGISELDDALEEKGVLDDYNIVSVTEGKGSSGCDSADDGCAYVGLVWYGGGSDLKYAQNMAYSNETYGTEGHSGPSAEELAALGYTLSYEDYVEEGTDYFGNPEYQIYRQYFVTDEQGNTYELEKSEKNYWYGYEVADGSGTWVNTNKNTNMEMSLDTSGSPDTSRLTELGFTDLHEENGDYVATGPDGEKYILEPHSLGLTPWYNVVDTEGNPYLIDGDPTAPLSLSTATDKTPTPITDDIVEGNYPSTSDSDSDADSSSASSSTSGSISGLSSSVRSAYPSFSLSDVSETEKSYLSGSSSAGNDINGDGKFTYADVISLVQCWNNSACRGD